ncbi:glucose-6-phosphate dehydrogenase (NADP(+)), partial [Candidatus Saccharibacteria bacterium]|nr:glucose-6-phosphate dehydrogenase (NADP(+)) [Candidatus Saccharibacteria bacterium]
MKSYVIEQPTILVIVGISGDLARRKLIPALLKIYGANILPKKFRIVGVSTNDITHADIFPKDDKSDMRDKTEITTMDLTDAQACRDLGARLDKIEEAFGATAQHLFYLAVPPQVVPVIVENLGQAGMLKRHDAKLLLEKPFGVDLESALERVEQLRAHCEEEQIYRIDHYLAKEMAQNLIVFRNGNSLIKRTWSRDFIESIEIIAAEQIGIEGRTVFYEQTGALRDFVQSHLLQLAALILMELPSSTENWDDVPERRLRALSAIEPPRYVSEQVQRGQYIGYREEVGNPDSTVETYVSMTLYSRDWRWQGVPITLTTGKALDRKRTEIRVRYRQEDSLHANELIMHVQPNEGVTLQMWVKKPGHEHELQELPLNVAYEQHFSQLPDAYERVLADAMLSNRVLFTTSEETIASWRILEPVQKAWEMSSDDLFFYKPGQDPKKIGLVMPDPILDSPLHYRYIA